MKKPLAITLLVLGGLAAVFGAAMLGLILILVLMWGGLLIGIAAVMGMAFGADRMRILYKRKYGMNAAKFFLCAYVPPIVGSVILFVVVELLDEAGYFSGLFPGLGEFLMALSCVIASGAFAAAGGIWLTVSTIIERKRAGLSAFAKPAAVVLLILGGAVLWTAMLFGLQALWIETKSAIPSVLIIIGVTFGIALLGLVYKKQFGIGAPVYSLCAYFPAAAWKVFTIIVYFEKLSVDREYGFPTADDNAFFLRYEPIEAAAVLVCAVVWFAVLAAITRRKGSSA